MIRKRDNERIVPPTVAMFSDASLFQVVWGGKSRVKLPPPDQICIVVKNIDEAIKYYSSIFGWGPFFVRELQANESIYNGKLCCDHLKIALALSGLIEIELIQVIEGETPHSDFLKEKGEGVHHLRFLVDNMEDTLSKLAEDGIEPIWRRPGGSAVYLNSESVGGVTFELIQRG
jgi:catechol 2,3-dioxygenase-like lactoylglutathione lyase family enzyme